MNKEQLEKLSDFEINCLITKHIPVIMEDEQPSKWDTTDFVMVNDIASMYPLDFCNNWSDMGPLVDEAGIYWCPTDDLKSVIYHDASYRFKVEISNPTNKCHLRAAAIVYLLMQEDKE